MNNMLKNGDKVRCINARSIWCVKNEVFTVTDLYDLPNNEQLLHVVDTHGDYGTYWIKSFHFAKVNEQIDWLLKLK